MARARHEADAQPLEVVVRPGVDLELAAVARAGIDMADGKSAPEMLEHRLAQALLDLAQRWTRAAGPRSRCARSASGWCTWLEVVSAVAQVEGLVDQRKVRDDVAEHCALERRPVLPRRSWAWTRCRVPSSPASRAMNTSPRQPSIQPQPRVPAWGAFQAAWMPPGGRRSTSSSTSRIDHSSSKRTVNRAATSPRL